MLAKQVWAFCARLELSVNFRDLALFNLVVDSALRGCDLVRLKVTDSIVADRVRASRSSRARPSDRFNSKSPNTRAIPSGIGFAALRRSVAPICFTSTLFLFFVEDRLQLSGKAGPLLILFFLSVGLSVPLWAKVSRRVGAKKTLLIAMPLAILGFVGAAFLAPGNVVEFWRTAAIDAMK